MRSCAEELMDYCQAEGLGKVGETLFYGYGFNDEGHADILVFNDAVGGGYERRMDGVALEHNFVELQGRGSIPGDVFKKVDAARRLLETMKGHETENFHYESVLGMAAPRLLAYDSSRRYIYTMTIKVLRRDRALDGR